MQYEAVHERKFGMNKIATSTLAALMAVTAVIPATTTSAEAGHRRGAWIAGGVILGATALAIAGSRRAHASEVYVDEDEDEAFRRRCHQLEHRCNEGSDWACEKYERRGC
jgi:hypothetical protein